MPNTLQYPLERERELQRRWSRLLQRTLVTREHPLDSRRGAARRAFSQQGVRTEPGRSRARRSGVALD